MAQVGEMIAAGGTQLVCGQHGGRYFAADRLSVADLKVFVWIRYLKSGALDHVPTDLPDRVSPKLLEHYERIKSDPRVKAYYAKHGIAG